MMSLLSEYDLEMIRCDPAAVAPLKEVIRRLVDHIDARKPTSDSKAIAARLVDECAADWSDAEVKIAEALTDFVEQVRNEAIEECAEQAKAFSPMFPLPRDPQFTAGYVTACDDIEKSIRALKTTPEAST